MDQETAGMRDLDGIRCLVTGGASGIGAAAVAQLRARGALVAVLDLGFEFDDPGQLRFRCDVASTVSVDGAVDSAAAALDGLDVVVNNAGIGASGSIEAFDEREWHHVLDVNVLGVARVTAVALPHLRASHHPAVVNTASVLASVGVPDRALYSATKGAVVALSTAMAADYIGYGIRVNCVLPGTTDTPWVQRLLAAAEDPEAARRALVGRQPIGRLVTPEEVAFAIANLASPHAGSTTGTTVTIDGGLTHLRLPN